MASKKHLRPGHDGNIGPSTCGPCLFYVVVADGNKTCKEGPTWKGIGPQGPGVEDFTAAMYIFYIHMSPILIGPMLVQRWSRRTYVLARLHIFILSNSTQMWQTARE
jgi:hypothetical protein